MFKRSSKKVLGFLALLAFFLVSCGKQVDIIAISSINLSISTSSYDNFTLTNTIYLDSNGEEVTEGEVSSVYRFYQLDYRIDVNLLPGISKTLVNSGKTCDLTYELSINKTLTSEVITEALLNSNYSNKYLSKYDLANPKEDEYLYNWTLEQVDNPLIIDYEDTNTIYETYTNDNDYAVFVGLYPRGLFNCYIVEKYVVEGDSLKLDLVSCAYSEVRTPISINPYLTLCVYHYEGSDLVCDNYLYDSIELESRPLILG